MSCSRILVDPADCRSSRPGRRRPRMSRSTRLRAGKASGRPWGPWATIGWTLLCIVVVIRRSARRCDHLRVVRAVATGSLKVDDLVTNGNLMAFATLLSTPATVGLIALLDLGPSLSDSRLSRPLLAAGAIRRDRDGRDWRSCSSPPILTSYLTGRPLVPTVMVDMYRSSWLPGLLFAMVVLAPIGEETLFRGFLYAGIAASRAGPDRGDHRQLGRLCFVARSIRLVRHCRSRGDRALPRAWSGIGLGRCFLTMLLHAVAQLRSRRWRWSCRNTGSSELSGRRRGPRRQELGRVLPVEGFQFLI